MSKNDGKLRKSHDGRFAGSGIDWSFYENEETYKDVKVNVQTDYDYMTKEQRKSLNGPVKTYHISELEDDENVRKTTHSKRRK